MLYKRYAPLIYGFIMRTVTNPSVATEILRDTFTRVYKQVDKFDPKTSSIFIYMLNIARHLISLNKAEHSACSRANEFVLYKGMNCEQAANAMHQSQNEVKKDLRNMLLKSKLSSI